MKQLLKTVIPIAVLMAVIFGVTFFAQYRAPVEEKEEVSTEPPLRFGSTTRQWNPVGSLQEQIFPGFYEVQANAAGPKNSARFWLENRNPKPVTLQLKGVSCASCSAGRLAPIPPEVTRQLLQMSIVSGLPQGLGGGLGLGLAGPAARLAPENLQWQEYEFRETPHATFVVPAATNNDGLSPQWGILELQFSVGAIGPKTLTAEFVSQVEGSKDFSTTRFGITFEGVNPFDVFPGRIDVGELTENSEPKSYELLVYSSTRGPTAHGPGDLQPPAVDIRLPAGTSGEVGEFVTVGQPVRLPETQLDQIAIDVTRRLKKPTRVTASYRVPVTVAPRVGSKRIDIGPLERDIWVAVPDALPRSVPLRGTVRGGVWLDDDLKEISLSYLVASGLADRQFRLIAEGRDAEVTLLRDECRPDFLRVTLEKEPVQATDRTTYQLKINIPANTKTGSWTGSVVLELKTSGQKIRIPVKGTGRL